MCLCLNFLYKNQNLTAEQIAMKFGKEVVLKGRKNFFQGGGFTTIPTYGTNARAAAEGRNAHLRSASRHSHSCGGVPSAPAT